MSPSSPTIPTPRPPLRSPVSAPRHTGPPRSTRTRLSGMSQIATSLVRTRSRIRRAIRPGTRGTRLPRSKTGESGSAGGAADDEFLILEDSPGNTLDVLSNDTNAGSGNLSISIDTTPAHGTLALDATQNITYIPDPGYIRQVPLLVFDQRRREPAVQRNSLDRNSGSQRRPGRRAGRSGGRRGHRDRDRCRRKRYRRGRRQFVS